MLLTQIYWKAQKTCILYYLGTKRSGSGRCGCDQRTKHGQEELRHVPGQGQQPTVPGCDGARTAKKSYPSPRSGAVGGKSYPTSEVRGGRREELPCVRGQGWRLRGDTPWTRSGAVAGRSYPTAPRPRPGAAARRTNPMSKEQWLCGHRRV